LRRKRGALRRTDGKRRRSAASPRVVARRKPLRCNRLRGAMRENVVLTRRFDRPFNRLRRMRGPRAFSAAQVPNEKQRRGKRLDMVPVARMARTLTAARSLAANRRQRSSRDFFVRQRLAFQRRRCGGGTRFQPPLPVGRGKIRWAEFSGVGSVFAAQIGKSFKPCACPGNDFRGAFFLRKFCRRGVSFNVGELRSNRYAIPPEQSTNATY
jgi:hypothetical protein